MNSGSRKWIKLWVDPWLSSTMRFTLDHKHRAVWADLLALGGQSRVSGVICSGEECGEIIGLPLLRIAGLVDVPTEELSGMLTLFEKQERIKVERDSGGRVIIRLLNWSKYQSEYERQKKYRQPTKGVTKRRGEKLQQELQRATVKSYSPEVEGEGEYKDSCANPDGLHGSVPPQNPPSNHEQTILRVWNYYLEKLSKNPKLLAFTSARKKKGLARLRECLGKTGGDLAKAEALMKLAVDALAASDFHRGANDRHKAYDTWERHLFPNQEKLEWWLEQAQ